MKVLKRIGFLLLLPIYSYMAAVFLFIMLGYNVTEIRGYEWFQYGHYYWDNPKFTLKLIISGVLPIVVIGGIFAMFIIKPKQIYGDARWARTADIMRAKLFSKRGLILGRHSGKYIMSDTPTHALLVAPTRSGKGVGVVIPNCLNWSGSLVCLDVKQENYKITSGFRAKFGQECFLWSPMATDKKSARFNPLDMVSNDPDQRVTDLQIIANLLVSVSEKEPMWGQEAQSLFVGAALYVMDAPDMPSTIGAVYRLLSTNEDITEVFQFILENQAGLSPQIKMNLGNFAAKAPREASGVKSSLMSSLRIFSNPMVDSATSESDFDLHDLRRKKISIYVGVLPNQLETLAPLLRLFFQQVISIMSEQEPGADEPHHVLMLLDEFPSIGAMDSVVTAFTLLAGYHVRVLAIIQGLSWIDKNYGRDTREGLIANCAQQIFFATNDETTSKYVSDALGEKTVKSTTLMKNPFAFTVAKGSKTISAMGRPLLMPQEVRRLDKNKAVILSEGAFPILANKIFYYKSKTFKARLLDAVPVPPLQIVNHDMPNLKISSDDDSDGQKIPASTDTSENKTVNHSLIPEGTDFDPNGPQIATLSPDGTQSSEYMALMEIFKQERQENPDFEAALGDELDGLGGLM